MAQQLATELSLAIYRGEFAMTLARLKSHREKNARTYSKQLIIERVEYEAKRKVTGRAELSVAGLLKKYPNRISTQQDAERLMSWLDKGRKPATVNRHLTVLRRAAPELFASIPKRKCQPPVEPRPFTADEVTRILATLRGNQYSHYYPYVLFLLHTGVRTSEAIGLRWQDVDLSRRVAYISTSLPSAGNTGERVRKSTKTGKARVVPLDDEVVGILDNLLRTQQLVFPAPKGQPINDKNFARRCWKKTLEQAGVEYRRPYNCRHTYVSHALACGANVRELAGITGHDPLMLLTRYAGLVRTVPPPKLGY